MPQVMIRYKLKPDQVERNLELLHAAYEEMESAQPDGLRWASFQLENEVSFVDFVAGEAGQRYYGRCRRSRAFGPPSTSGARSPRS